MRSGVSGMRCGVGGKGREGKGREGKGKGGEGGPKDVVGSGAPE